jgi:hypothetical protein
MVMGVRIWLTSALFAGCWSLAAFAGEVTPSVVFAESVKIEREVALLKQHLGVELVRQVAGVHAPLRPRHSWQIGHLMLTKINIFRRQRGFPVLAANSLEPVMELEPLVVYEMTQRILLEIALIKRRLGITGSIEAVAEVPGKRPIDVFNKLNAISSEWDLLNLNVVSPHDVYAEVKRLNGDVDVILRHQRINDRAYPPARVADASPADSLAAAFDLLGEIQRLQQQAGLGVIDYTAFRTSNEVRPSDVLTLVTLALADLQTVKAYLGLGSELTLPAERQGEKVPADVHQFLGYVANRLRQVDSL